MKFTTLPKDLPAPIDDGACGHLLNKTIPNVGLPNQDGNILKLNRSDTFRLIIYCYPMTGHPKKTLPKNWNKIPGARGCTPQTCSFRDGYDDFIKLNSIPIGLSTQNVKDIKEMTTRLSVPYDVVSDEKLTFINLMKLPTFNIENRVYVKRMTMIVEKTVIKHVFYPVYPPDLHFTEVIHWLKNN